MIGLLLRRSPRERGLLALLFGLALPAALVFGLLLPLAERRAAAAAALQQDRALHAWVTARVAEKRALQAGGQTGPRTPVGLSGLEQSLIAANLRAAVRTLANRPGGGVELGFDAVPFAALIDWLSASDPGWGYDIAELRLLRGAEPGLVAADLRLEPQG